MFNWTPPDFGYHNMEDVRNSNLEPDEEFLEWWEVHKVDFHMDRDYQDSAMLMWPLMQARPKLENYSLTQFVVLVNKMILRHNKEQK